ncbi:MAG: HigA family addiction module antidote protein [Deltaproteobacteria bacterium]|nr:HigA family addiction module antidote protein [Deltaproteobacteria bacterium]
MMHNPPHPGEVIRELCIEPLGVTVTEAAAALGVSRKALSELLNGHTGISPEMAVRRNYSGQLGTMGRDKRLTLHGLSDGGEDIDALLSHGREVASDTCKLFCPVDGAKGA